MRYCFGKPLNSHKLTVKDPALSLTVNEFYWNIYAAAGRLDLANAMEMGGFSRPTSADFLYRLLPALETLAKTHPERLDTRFQLGMTYRWNNDQIPMIETFEALVKDIPTDRPTPRAEMLVQLAWSRINKVAWNQEVARPEQCSSLRGCPRLIGHRRAAARQVFRGIYHGLQHDFHAELWG